MTVYNIVGASEEEAEMRKLTTLNYVLCTRKPLVKLLLLIILVFLITELVIFSKAPEKSTSELIHNEPNWLTEEITPKTPVEMPIIPQGRTDLSLCDIGFLISATDSNHTGYLKKSWLKRLCGNHMDPYREKPYPAFPRLSRQSKKNAKGEDNWMIYDDLLTMEDDECASFSSSVCCNLNKQIKGLYEKWPKNIWYMIVDSETIVIPKNVQNLLNTLDHTSNLFIGGEAFVVLSSSGDIVRPLRNLPYGPPDGLYFIDNTKVIPKGSGFIFSHAMLETLFNNLIILGQNCRKYEQEEVTVAVTIHQLKGALITHPGFNWEQDKLSKWPQDLKYFKSAPLTWNLNRNIEGMEMFDFIFNSHENLSPPIFDDLTDKVKKKDINSYQVQQQVTAQKLSNSDCIDMIGYHQSVLMELYGRLLKGVRRVAIIGFPNHSNKGDSAIWVGEIILLERLGIEVVYRCSSNEDYHPHQMKEGLYGGTESRRVPKSETAILLHGGGNFGDLYKMHQRLRSRVVSSFTSSKIVSFPQTITFTEWNYLEKVKRDYSGHDDLALVARDLISMEILKKHFFKHQIYLAPDCAFMIGYVPNYRQKPSVDIYIHQRRDKEGMKQKKERKGWMPLNSIQNHNSSSVQYAINDWIQWDTNAEYLRSTGFDERAWLRTMDAFNFLSKGELVITNRLHGHILSTLLGIPHIILDTSFGKLSSYHNTWVFSCQSIVKVAANVKEAVKLATEFYSEAGWKTTGDNVFK